MSKKIIQNIKSYKIKFLTIGVLALTMFYQNCTGFSSKLTFSEIKNSESSTALVDEPESSENYTVLVDEVETTIEPPSLDSFNPNQRDPLKAAFADLRKGIELKTHRKWKFIEQEPLVSNCLHGCIKLILNEHPDLVTSLPPIVAHVVKEKGPVGVDAFFLIPDTQLHNIYIVGNSLVALSNAVYFYLNKIGVTWLMPNDHWINADTIDDYWFFKKTIFQEPSFLRRSFFGTGGLGPFPEQNQVWQDWKRRNFWNYSFSSLGGHMYQNFYESSKARALLRNESSLWNCTERSADSRLNEEIITDSDCPPPFRRINPYLAGSMNVYTDINIGSPRVVEAFVEYMKDTLSDIYNKDPNAVDYVLSLEPADGDDYCRSITCTQIGNPTDQVIFLANESARSVQSFVRNSRDEHFRNISTRLFYTILAYSGHLNLPEKISELDPAVIVQMIPYGFNRTGLSPDQLIKGWRKLNNQKMAIYDYLSITDWAQGFPSVDTADVFSKLAVWKQNKILSVNFESSYSGISHGAVFYVLSRYLLDSSQDPDKLLNQFYSLAYGRAASTMKNLFEEKWGAHFSLNYFSLKDGSQALAKARIAETNPIVQKRFDDFEIYLKYLYLRLDYDDHKSSDTNGARLENLIYFLKKIQTDNVIASYRLIQLLRDKVYTNSTLYNSLPSENDPIDPTKYKNTITPFEDPNFFLNINLTSLIDPYKVALEGTKAKGTNTEFLTLPEGDETYLFSTDLAGVYPLGFRFSESINPNARLEVYVYSQGLLVTTRRITSSEILNLKYNDIIYRNIPVPKGQNLTVKITSNVINHSLVVPENLGVALIDQRLHSMQGGTETSKVYVSVPADLTRVYFSGQQLSFLKICPASGCVSKSSIPVYDAEDHLVDGSTVIDKSLLYFNCSDLSKENAFFSIQTGSDRGGGVLFYNIPNLYNLNPRAMLIQK